MLGWIWDILELHKKKLEILIQITFKNATERVDNRKDFVFQQALKWKEVYLLGELLCYLDLKKNMYQYWPTSLRKMEVTYMYMCTTKIISIIYWSIYKCQTNFNFLVKSWEGDGEQSTDEDSGDISVNHHLAFFFGIILQAEISFHIVLKSLLSVGVIN